MSIPQTPHTTDVPFAKAQDVLACYAQGIVADLCRVTPNSPPPSYLALLDNTNPAGKRLYKHMQIGAGEIQSFCSVSKRYTVEDLQALTGVSQELLIKLNCARAFWSLANYLKPITSRPEDVPFAKESYDLLILLRDGERIFSFYESESAGLPTVNEAQPSQLITPNVVGYARRLFPLAGLNRNGPWVNQNSGNRGGGGGS